MPSSERFSDALAGHECLDGLLGGGADLALLASSASGSCSSDVVRVLLVELFDFLFALFFEEDLLVGLVSTRGCSCRGWR